MIEVRPCLSPDPFVPSPGPWSEAELDTLRDFAGLVQAGAIPVERARDWRNVLAALEFVVTLDPIYVGLCGRAEAQLREGLLEIATAGLAELVRLASEAALDLVANDGGLAALFLRGPDHLHFDEHALHEVNGELDEEFPVEADTASSVKT